MAGAEMTAGWRGRQWWRTVRDEGGENACGDDGRGDWGGSVAMAGRFLFMRLCGYVLIVSGGFLAGGWVD